MTLRMTRTNGRAGWDLSGKGARTPSPRERARAIAGKRNLEKAVAAQKAAAAAEEPKFVRPSLSELSLDQRVHYERTGLLPGESAHRHAARVRAVTAEFGPEIAHSIIKRPSRFPKPVLDGIRSVLGKPGKHEIQLAGKKNRKFVIWNAPDGSFFKAKTRTKTKRDAVGIVLTVASVLPTPVQPFAASANAAYTASRAAADGDIGRALAYGVVAAYGGSAAINGLNGATTTANAVNTGNAFATAAQGAENVSRLDQLVNAAGTIMDANDVAQAARPQRGPRGGTVQSTTPRHANEVPRLETPPLRDNMPTVLGELREALEILNRKKRGLEAIIKGQVETIRDPKSSVHLKAAAWRALGGNSKDLRDLNAAIRKLRAAIEKEVRESRTIRM